MPHRNARRRLAAFTFVEMLVAMAVGGIFLSGLLAMWNVLGSTALNTTTVAQRQSDQIRVLDYLKRDIRRATTVELYDGATLVTGTTTFATELRLTIPDYYADSRADDNAFGINVPVAPAVSDGVVEYGTAMTVRYFAQGGAVVRDEAGTARTVAAAAGAFVLTFKRETTGAVRCSIVFDQPLRSGSARKLRRLVDTLCLPRSELQL